MAANTEVEPDFLAEFGRLHGTNAWCIDPMEMVADGPYLQINLGQEYDICGVEAQGEPGGNVRTRFTLSYSIDGTSFTGFNSNQVTRYCRICDLCPYVSDCICPSQTSRGDSFKKGLGSSLCLSFRG